MKEMINHRIIDTIGDHIGMPDGVEPVSIPMLRLKEPPQKPPGLKSIRLLNFPILSNIGIANIGSDGIPSMGPLMI